MFLMCLCLFYVFLLVEPPFSFCQRSLEEVSLGYQITHAFGIGLHFGILFRRYFGQDVVKLFQRVDAQTYAVLADKRR